VIRSIAGVEPVVALPDFSDAYETQRVLEAAAVSAKERVAVRLSEIK
jgi:predicted dehydrogenase